MKKVIALSIVILLSSLVVSTSLIQADTVVATLWNIETVDSGTTGEYISMVLDSDDKPHISYSDLGVKYARWTGSAWEIEPVDLTPLGETYISLALDSEDKPHISYSDIKYARWTGSAWEIEPVLIPGSAMYTSLALDSSDKPHICYSEDEGDLWYTKWTGSVWEIEPVDLTPLGETYISLALDSEDKPHISYSNRYGGLKYARWTGSAWEIESVDPWLDTAVYTSIVLDSDDKPHISYSDSGGDVKYARCTGSVWEIEPVDLTLSAVTYTSLALDSDDKPHISYSNVDFGVKYARWTGSAWEIEPVDLTLSVETFTSLALDSGDKPHISYRNEMNDIYNLKYASKATVSYSVSPSSQTVTAGGSTNHRVTLTQTGTPHDPVSLSLNLPPEIGVYKFNPQSGTLDFNSRLVINIHDTAPPGTYDLTITTIGPLTLSIPLTLTVTAKPELSLNLQPQVVNRGSTFNLWGHLQPARATSILLYRRDHESGIWTLMKNIQTDSSGDYTLKISVSNNLQPGEYDLKAVWFHKANGYYTESPIQHLIIN